MQVLNVKATVKVPTVPNFLISDGDMKFPLSAFDDEALRQIGEAWLTELLNNAERQRMEARNKDAPREYADANKSLYLSYALAELDATRAAMAKAEELAAVRRLEVDRLVEMNAILEQRCKAVEDALKLRQVCLEQATEDNAKAEQRLAQTREVAKGLREALHSVLTAGAKPDMSVKENRDAFDAAIANGRDAIDCAAALLGPRADGNQSSSPSPLPGLSRESKGLEDGTVDDYF